MITGRIGNEDRGLALTNLVGGARHDHVLARRLRREVQAPRMERERTVVLPERRRGFKKLVPPGSILRGKYAEIAILLQSESATECDIGIAKLARPQ